MPEGGVLITCEHARPDVPRSVHLGLGDQLARSELAYDPGAMEAAQSLAMRLGAPLLMGQVSRLVVDLGLNETHPECVPDLLRDTPIPGNMALSEEQRRGRIAVFHRPYRRALLDEIELILDHGRCVHISVHTWSPRSLVQSHELEVGICYDPNRRGERCWGTRMLASLRDAGFDARPSCANDASDVCCADWLREQFNDQQYAGLDLQLSQGLSPERQLRAIRVAANALRTATAEDTPCC